MMKKNLFHAAALALCLCATYSCTNPGPSQKANTQTADSAQIAAIVQENILTRRSIRKYQKTSIPDSVLQEILKCGIYAPNGQGKESWQVRVIESPQMLAEMDSCYRKYMTRIQPEKAAGSTAAYSAPTVVVIAYDKHYDFSQIDCGLLGGNIMLAAHARGIGSCCLGGLGRAFLEPEFKELAQRLQLPDTHEVLYAIALGYPDQQPKAKERDSSKIQFIR